MTTIESNLMLQYLEMLLKHGTFTKASKELYISQPYLTQTIKKTEKILGVSIINRTSKPLQLTEAGKIYYQHLTSLEIEQDNFMKKIHTLSYPDHQTIRIGILSSLGTYLLPIILPKFIKKNPNLMININEDIPSANEDKVLNGDLDFLIGQNPETISPNLTVKDCGSHSYFALIPNTSSLYQKNTQFLPEGTLSIRQLLSEPLVLTTRGSAIRRQIDYLLQKNNITPNISLECDNIFTVGELASHGVGITLLPESTLPFQNLDNCNLYLLNQELISLKYFIAFSNKKNLTPEEEQLIQIFTTEISKNIKNKNRYFN
ncbi:MULTISPECIES: LysR family transcriptional regulator [Vagococcus]|uniref:Predicted transcriptional regulators n=1 Tax=Vagococcus fluvialis bH819 TaxID=1255619 RepID=A0A1X6WPT9_9ENTE|nr:MULTISPECIES: LysR family transcriptional regulator [Vagococcus]SLM86277.1 Predicted transcriptional regulators [Vagococcus fluvialis bH819]HCM88896.1 LysR family transcriptional regulator [Vagococcus sp.]